LKPKNLDSLDCFLATKKRIFHDLVRLNGRYFRAFYQQDDFVKNGGAETALAHWINREIEWANNQGANTTDVSEAWQKVLDFLIKNMKEQAIVEKKNRTVADTNTQTTNFF
tara:strand:- start:367 stop:699 length:333 start_codon:yes stop_codon:yes gene_type:complete